MGSWFSYRKIEVIDMKKLLVLTLALAFIASYSSAQSVETTVTNRGEVITVYVAEGGGSTNLAANQARSVPTDFTVGDDLIVTDDAAVGGDLAVAGTAAVAGVLTLTAAPKLTATTAVSTNTATMTTAPVAGNPAAWANVSIGTNTYCIPLFAIE